MALVQTVTFHQLFSHGMNGGVETVTGCLTSENRCDIILV